FDTKERRCTIYKARPAACRDYPGNNCRCGYYDFLMHERRVQDDDTFVAKLRLAIGRPSCVRRISGSLPTLPTRMTLLTEPAIHLSPYEIGGASRTPELLSRKLSSCISALPSNARKSRTDIRG